MERILSVVFLLLPLLLLQCSKPGDQALFTLIDKDHTGVEFENRIMETDSMNAIRFEYIYNGAGVGIGDFNGDSLPDIFFAGNMVSSKLYLNKGGFSFEDVTLAAKLNTTYWCTGVAVN